VRPLPFLDGVQYQPEHSEDLAQSMTAQAPPHLDGRLADTERDAEEQWRFEPIKKLRKNSQRILLPTTKPSKIFCSNDVLQTNLYLAGAHLGSSFPLNITRADGKGAELPILLNFMRPRI